MITLNQIDRDKLQAALTRATDLTLRSTDIPGVYFVGSGLKLYMVVIAKQNNKVEVSCTCPANEFGNVCKHAAICLADMKAKLEAKKHLCASCGLLPVTEADGTCQLCIQEDAQDLEEFLFMEELQPRYRRSA